MMYIDIPDLIKLVKAAYQEGKIDERDFWTRELESEFEDSKCHKFLVEKGYIE